MHKLDLETLTKERLEESVDAETYNLGLHLYKRHAVQVIDLVELNARCIVRDVRSYQVHFKVEGQHLYLKCSCSHASRGLICEHDVAAWLALQDQLTANLPPAWKQQIEAIVDTLAASHNTPFRQPYYLFFSLQKDPANSSLTWKIAPWVLSSAALPAESADSETAEIDWEQLLQARPDLLARLRPVYQPLDGEGCLNGGRQAASLANLMLSQKRTGHDLEFPLGVFLPLVLQTAGTLAIGDPQNPLKQILRIAPTKGRLSLKIDRGRSGLVIRPEILAGDHSFELRDQDLRIIHENPLWVLADRDICELEGGTPLAFLAALQSLANLTIPPEDEATFADIYLAQLASEVEIGGDAIFWEELAPDPKPRLYLSETNGELLIQLRFVYQEIELDFDPELPAASIQHRPGSLNLVRVKRQPLQELGWRDLLTSTEYGLKRAPLPAKSGLFRLRARVHPVGFLLDSLPRLAQDGFEVFGEEKLRSARVNRNTPAITFRVSSGIDWFDVHAEVSFGDLVVPIKEIRRLIRKQERYVKLSDGSIGEIPEEWLERYRHLFAVGEIQAETLRFSRHHITLIDQAVASADQLELDEEFSRRRTRLRSMLDSDFKGIQAYELPTGFCGELRPYQKAGFDWLHFLRECEFGGCLADDMGLGKTVQTLVFLESLYHGEYDQRRPKAASLLVVPRSLLVNWQREAARFTPDLKFWEYFETNREKDTGIFDQQEVIITTYGVMLRDIQFLHGYPFHYAVLDESQSIKNPLSQTARAAHLLQAEHRLVLTGTPMENSTAELWSQFAFLNPGLLGNIKYFKDEFGVPIERKQDEKAAERLRRVVFPFILRRTKDQVAPELPPRTERILYCDMEPAQRKLYNRTRDSYRGMLLGMVENQGLNESRMKILEGLLRLRQISNHPALVDEKFHGSSGKFDFLLETLETLRLEGHKVLVFSQFVKMLSLVRRVLDEREVPYNYLDGQTSARQEQVDLFQTAPEIPFFLISLRAGGLGLNLTAADYVIHIDPWWNPAVELQATDRTHRIGQARPVFVFKLIARDSVEEKILVLQERKKHLVDQIITTESAFFKNLSAEDVQALFS